MIDCIVIMSIPIYVFLKGQVLSLDNHLGALTTTQKRTGHQHEILKLIKVSSTLGAFYKLSISMH